MRQYPSHTLAPDPDQPVLDLRPPESYVDFLLRSRPSGRVLCQHCGSIHGSQAEVLSCKAGR